MSIPILKYSLSTQNQRVNSFEYLAGEEQPKIYTTENLPSAYEMDEIIWAAYRQIFSEHQILSNTRQIFLESQLRFNQIKIRDFIRSLLLSDTFRFLNFDINNNYRFVEICIQRALGRDVYNEREKIALSIVIASKGLASLVDFILDSEEYMNNFGDNIVPYQRRRIITQRNKGEIPFNLKTPRFDKSILGPQTSPQIMWSGAIRKFRPQELSPKAGDPALFLNMVNNI
uniref:Phycobilisome rod-core linker polypeptide n=1 Tax=Caloglossa beccarii TaxID=131038 RepID=A0A1Z1M8Z1_9FLOR|nr:phycobilisome rod-core linker polypeptide [Caloglossa beccarii]ARW62245.1 phycobilisome rod-core linker polypeptide [Caloglossa beccarii]